MPRLIKKIQVKVYGSATKLIHGEEEELVFVRLYMADYEDQKKDGRLQCEAECRSRGETPIKPEDWRVCHAVTDGRKLISSDKGVEFVLFIPSSVGEEHVA